MEFKRKQSSFCDSGYNSLDVEEDKDDKQEDSTVKQAVNQAENDESFSDWLKKVAKCLHSKPKVDYYKNKVEKDETEDEGSRCMRIVRSVLDEKTVLGMTKDYLHYAKVTLIITISLTMFIMYILRTLSCQTMLRSSSRAVNLTKKQELLSSELSSTATCCQK